MQGLLILLCMHMHGEHSNNSMSSMSSMSSNDLIHFIVPGPSGSPHVAVVASKLLENPSLIIQQVMILAGYNKKASESKQWQKHLHKDESSNHCIHNAPHQE